MSRLTVFLARLLGLFTVLLVGILLIRGSTIIEAAAADGPLMLTYAIISLALGLAMILGHNVWSGGAPPSGHRMRRSLPLRRPSQRPNATIRTPSASSAAATFAPSMSL